MKENKMSKFKDVKIHMNAAIERAFEEIECITDKWGNETYVWGGLTASIKKDLKKSIQNKLEIDFLHKG
jgi:hypothetical protein